MKKKKARNVQQVWHLYEMHAVGTSKVCACAKERQPGFGGILASFNTKAECQQAKKKQ
jgi:hypothetical protein